MQVVKFYYCCYFIIFKYEEGIQLCNHLTTNHLAIAETLRDCHTFLAPSLILTTS